MCPAIAALGSPRKDNMTQSCYGPLNAPDAHTGTSAGATHQKSKELLGVVYLRLRLWGNILTVLPK